MVLSAVPQAFATPEYSGETAQGCLTCHLKAEGGTLNENGLRFAASGYVWPPTGLPATGGYRVMGPIGKTVRLIIGTLHVAGSFIWFGAILYVHILLRPAYASKGLPKAEVVLGLASMSVVGITGVLLTVSKIRSLDVLFESAWGIVLSVKILLYLLMVSSALFTVTFVGPRLRRTKQGAVLPKNNIFDSITLSAFDGKEGRPALIAYKGQVYDVTGRKLWKDGIHLKHSAGGDLTGAIAKAPHGEENLNGIAPLGVFDAELKPPLNPAQKAFYFIAYMNLALVFVVIIVISVWRWGGL